MAGDPFLRAMHRFVRTSRLIDRGDRIVVAVSGGIDSVVLLDCLDSLKSRMEIELAVAHFNHQLRGQESNDDEEFVRTIASERGLKYHADRGDVQLLAVREKLSIQDAARELRYAFFAKLRSSLGFDKIATAHHADDNAETILLNLFRGAGVHGLSGIPPLRRDLNVIRPMLFAGRDEIQTYAERRGLRYREDSTNARTDYTRNFIRHHLVPLVRQKINPNLTGTLQRMSELFDQLEQYIQNDVHRLSDNLVLEQSSEKRVLDLEKLYALPVFMQEHILRDTAREFTNSEIDFSAVKEMLTISEGETGSTCSLPRNSIVYRDRDRLIFTRKVSDGLLTRPIEINRRYEFETFTFKSEMVGPTPFTKDPNIEFVDATTIGKELCIRSWREGDWFVPLGMQDKKKVSDFFVDQKIPLLEKQSVPILASGDDIIWIVGRRLDDRHKVTPQTKSMIRFEYIPHGRS